MRFILLLFLFSCGKMIVETKDSNHQVNSKVDISLELEYIEDIRLMCADLFPDTEFPDKIEQRKLISQCTLDNIDLLSLDAVLGVNNENCENPINQTTSDLCALLKGSM